MEETALIKPRATRKLPECDRCLLCAHEPFVVCAVHPFGPEGDSCLDFRADPELESKRFVDFLGLQQQGDEPYSNPFDLEPNEELWEPEGAKFVNGELVIEHERSFYNGEEIIQPQQRWTREEQLNLLDWHPMFTGRCPHCERPFPKYEKPPVHWDCSACGWTDDTV